MKFTDLFQPNHVFTETEQYILRRIQPEELPLYKKLAQQETPSFLPQSDISALAWDDLLSEDHLTCSILAKASGNCCGFCQLQWIAHPSPELGIDLLPEYQNQGIAPEVLPAFLSQAKKLLQSDYFYSKIKKNNIPSQKLAEKIGGVCVGTKSLLPKDFPEEMTAFAEIQFPDFFYLEYHFSK